MKKFKIIYSAFEFIRYIEDIIFLLVLEYKNKLISAVTGKVEVFFLGKIGNSRSYLLQANISCLMAVVIVVILEAVDIQNLYCEAGICGIGFLESFV